MKKVFLAASLALLMVALVASPVAAQATKVTLFPESGETGSGFVIINNPAGEGHNLILNFSVKGAVPGRTYYAYLFVDGTDYPAYVPSSSYIGSATANSKGLVNLNIHYTIPTGEHGVWVELTNEAGTIAYYRDFSLYPTGSVKTFK